MKLVLASGNAGKLVEIREVLADLSVTLISQAELGVDDAEETGATFVENAILKARHAARLTGLPALGDDSGLCVDALDGAPGLLSARYAGSHGDSAGNISKLLDVLKDVPEARRTAHFFCVIVLLRHAEDPAPLIAEGRWHGRILHAPQGNGGFGYDPIFFDPQRNASAAELESAVKNRISHRGQALGHLRELLAREI
ncbi:MAG: RdgB/HAM1 family non-canonical purine NTP pyrophosphatase [Dokdonella sp.]|uniref:RdgB/HAM1 family non-canonical purine NTP pyrophosphatase n=1 Tax=Dokdonella sp. TaxID=2291710 RepID=UPI002BDC0589|nr:RdgB/HAM1 family non-canonical purine NTP pyrophosphatase [Dokdonella sp.]HOX70510.1 RdgB/HAM1 family non-canonical purine NTP pyrophosphatase [Dokdonella sp.]HPG93347.1 RdgB/HAM1 family non-canonical purine NTP pyrophosphatase [Dokdonella sp.]HPN78248.1 RdgB/HAM1 family non-canonical purine NTP pyrophosphatase [Dokdonella sp.]